jgi:Tol biopolymer transport system component
MMKLAALALGFLLALSLAAASGATPPGRNGLIVFSVQRGGDYDLLAVPPKGGTLVQLTRNDVDDGQPAWSPDGRSIAFVRATSIWITRADGSRARKLAAGVAPAWSPSGRRIAFTRNGRLAVMNTDGSGFRTLVAKGSSFNQSPSWSPNGRQIVFVRDSDLWVVSSAGAGLRQLTATELDEADPDWAPGGSRIVFTRHHPCGGSCDVPGLVTIRPDGTNEVEITDYGELVQPSWSPDGTMIVATGGGRAGLTILNASGELLRVIAGKADVSEQGVFDPAWQPIKA